MAAVSGTWNGWGETPEQISNTSKPGQIALKRNTASKVFGDPTSSKR